MVFQGAMHSLNPVIRVGDQVGERLTVGRPGQAAGARRASTSCWAASGLPAGTARRYPHELSGGMKQRVMIATALTHDPPLLILDEPTSALDVSIQAQIMNLLKELKAERRISMLFITHDLALASDLCDHIAVVYAGQLREHGSRRGGPGAAARPLHAGRSWRASRACTTSDRRASCPAPRPTSATSSPGCRFAPRCPLVFDACRTVAPALLTPGPGPGPRGPLPAAGPGPCGRPSRPADHCRCCPATAAATAPPRPRRACAVHHPAPGG